MELNLGKSTEYREGDLSSIIILTSLGSTKQWIEIHDVVKRYRLLIRTIRNQYRGIINRGSWTNLEM